MIVKKKPFLSCVVFVMLNLQEISARFKITMSNIYQYLKKNSIIFHSR